MDFMTRCTAILKFKNNVRYVTTTERGNTLAFLAIVLPVLLAMSGLAIDWGYGVHVKTDLQKAADSGALAAVSHLPDTSRADQEALALIQSNFEDPDIVSLIAQGDTYQIILTEIVPTFFMGIFGHSNVDVTVSATAITSRPVDGLRGGGFPFGLMNPELNLDPADDLTDWNFGRPYILGYGEANVMIEDWANGSAPNPPNPAGGGNAQGWRGVLGLTADGTMGNSGACDLRYVMEHGWPGSFSIGDEVPIKTGNMAGPTREGREAMLGVDPLAWGDFDVRIHGNEGRVAIVPIVHLIHDTRRDTYTVQDWNNGAAWDHDNVVVDGFAPFFILAEGEYEQYLNGVQGNAHDWIVGYFIPGVETSNFMPPDAGTPDFGLYVPPRLID